MRSYPLSRRERVRVRGFTAWRTSAKSLTSLPSPAGSRELKAQHMMPTEVLCACIKRLAQQ